MEERIKEIEKELEQLAIYHPFFTRQGADITMYTDDRYPVFHPSEELKMKILCCMHERCLELEEEKQKAKYKIRKNP